jgi:NAD-dependent dihydropyrimidine dehydrogenase PreA subunit
MKEGRKFKAVQTGGPMGGCLTEQHLDLPLDYEALTQAGSMMGSGGLVVMDETSCMVDIARFFMDFTQAESAANAHPAASAHAACSKCCKRSAMAKAKKATSKSSKNCATKSPSNSLCGLGQGAPNPVVSTLKHFRHEYEAHIYEKRCPAKVCRPLIRMEIQEPGLHRLYRLRAQLPGRSHQRRTPPGPPHRPETCIRCGICVQVCNFNAITVE